MYKTVDRATFYNTQPYVDIVNSFDLRYEIKANIIVHHIIESNYLGIFNTRKIRNSTFTFLLSKEQQEIITWFQLVTLAVNRKFAATFLE